MDDFTNLTLTNEDIFEIICMRLERSNTVPTLFGGGLGKIRPLIRPFLIGDDFPSIYLEFPLRGAPFLDATVLYDDIINERRIDSPLAGDCELLLERFNSFRRNHADICFGFEIDSANSGSLAAVHFQPFDHLELVRPFLESIGEASYAGLYTEFASRSESVWPPSFFGIFRGRSSCPLRVCGYIDKDEFDRICSSASYLRGVFDKLHFGAYSDEMISQIREVVDIAPYSVDYQMDIFPDKTIGPTFSLDVALPYKPDASIAKLFKRLGIADNRCHLLEGIVSNFAVPDAVTSGNIGFRRIQIRPAWLKIRWTDKVLQNAKCYTVVRAFKMTEGTISG